MMNRADRCKKKLVELAVEWSDYGDAATERGLHEEAERGHTYARQCFEMAVHFEKMSRVVRRKESSE